VRLGLAGEAWQVLVWRDKAGRGEARQGWARQAWYGLVGSGQAWLGMSAHERIGVVRLGRRGEVG
jgi:hypothetical protein